MTACRLGSVLRVVGCNALALAFLLAHADLADAQRRPIKELPKETPLRATSEIVKLFREAVAGPAQAVVRIRCDGRDAALGTIVADDGWILTKASQLTGKITVWIHERGEFEAKYVGYHEAHDLAMLKIEAKDLHPVKWGESKAAPVGNWVCCPATSDVPDPVAIGVVGVAARDVSTKGIILNPAKAGYLGVSLYPQGPGAKINQVMPKSAAEKAGIKVNDVIVSINGKHIPDQEALLNQLQRYKPDETVTVVVQRDGKEEKLEVTLGKRPLNRGDFQNNMGSELSDRRIGFPRILQHDCVLKPTDCGGPLVDLDGTVLGINIARAGRTETYTIPSETIQPLLADLKSGKLAPPSNSEMSAVEAARAALKSLEAEKDKVEKEIAQTKAALETAEKRLQDVFRKLDMAKAALEKAEAEAVKPGQAGPK
jgi:serine protease Do